MDRLQYDMFRLHFYDRDIFDEDTLYIKFVVHENLIC